MLRESLTGIKVVDFSQIGAGPTCSMYLGDLGADVIKVEPPSGDVGRKLGPPWYFERESAVYVAFNRNKRGVCLDLKMEGGLKVAQQLVDEADVLVESFRPGVLGRFGLGYDAVSVRNPQIVYCSVSAYGSTGESAKLAGVDGIVQAASGLMNLLGEDGQPPSKVQTPIVDISTGYIASIAVLAQLFQRTRTGKGGYLDVSMFATAVTLQQASMTGFLGDGALPERTGSAAPYSAPNEAFEAADGWVMVAAYLGDRWEKFCAILSLPEVVNDPRFATSSQRVLNRPAMRAAIAPAFKCFDCAQWLERLAASDILCSKVADYHDLMVNPALEHLQLIADMQGRNGKTYRTPGFPANCRESQSISHRAPPGLGEHTKTVLKELGYSDYDIHKLIASGAVSAQCTRGDTT
ncbi:MAG: CoA transferase [Glaciimonas sp.]|nr:CoA transferase [Glaciimonas sp.]